MTTKLITFDLLTFRSPFCWTPRFLFTFRNFFQGTDEITEAWKYGSPKVLQITTSFFSTCMWEVCWKPIARISHMRPSVWAGLASVRSYWRPLRIRPEMRGLRLKIGSQKKTWKVFENRLLLTLINFPIFLANSDALKGLPSGPTFVTLFFKSEAWKTM